MSDETTSPADDADVEGHGRRAWINGVPEDSDDVEGHKKQYPRLTDDTDDDVEGHKLQYPRVSDSLDDPFGPLKR